MHGMFSTACEKANPYWSRICQTVPLVDSTASHINKRVAPILESHVTPKLRSADTYIDGKVSMLSSLATSVADRAFSEGTLLSHAHCACTAVIEKSEAFVDKHLPPDQPAAPKKSSLAVRALLVPCKIPVRLTKAGCRGTKHAVSSVHETAWSWARAASDKVGLPTLWNRFVNMEQSILAWANRKCDGIFTRLHIKELRSYFQVKAERVSRSAKESAASATNRAYVIIVRLVGIKRAETFFGVKLSAAEDEASKQKVPVQPRMVQFDPIRKKPSAPRLQSMSAEPLKQD